MDELVEGVLPIGAWLSKLNLSSIEHQTAAVNAHSFAVGLHRHLHTAKERCPKAHGEAAPNLGASGWQHALPRWLRTAGPNGAALQKRSSRPAGHSAMEMSIAYQVRSLGICDAILRNNAWDNTLHYKPRYRRRQCCAEPSRCV